MAANPERVHIAVCCQGDDPETLAWLDTVPDLAYRYYTEEDAPGTCRARYDCSRMLGDEDYVLHLDSHMRFARHWDLMLLDQLARCGDEKAILTGHEHVMVQDRFSPTAEEFVVGADFMFAAREVLVV